MDQTTLLYISLITSILSLGFSIYCVLRFGKKKSKTSSGEVKTSKPTERKSNDLVEPPQPIVVDVVPQVEVEQKSDKSEKTEKIRPVPTGVATNTWNLEVSGPEGKQYNILIEWSDGTMDIESGTVPEEETFVHKKGVIPTRVVGIPPNGDEGVRYLWELNGFHWS